MVEKSKGAKGGNLGIKQTPRRCWRSDKDRTECPWAMITVVEEGGRNIDRSRRRSCSMPIHSCRSQGTCKGPAMPESRGTVCGR